MTKRIASIVVILTLVSTYAFSQEGWSLEKCINYAIANNLQVKQQVVSVKEDENQLLQNRMSRLPSVRSGVNYGLGWGRTLDPVANDFVYTRNGNGSASLDASAILFAGFQKQNVIKKSEIDLNADIQSVEKLKNDISLNVAAAYLQILLASETREAAKNQLETTKEQLEKTKRLVDAGSVTMGTYLELQAQQATEEVQLVNAENNITLSYLTLRQLLDLHAADAFKVAVPEIETVPQNVIKEGVDVIFENRAPLLPEVKSAEYRVQSAEKSLEIARGAYFPTLSLGASVGTRYSDTRKLQVPTSTPGVYTYESYPFIDQIRDDMNYGISFSLSIPIFSGWQTRIGVRNAKLNIHRTELQVQQVKNTLYQEIQQAEVDADAALKRYNASGTNVAALEESFRYVEQRFNVGAVTTTDYNVAKNNLFKAKSDQIQSKYQYIFQTKILDFYKGIPLTL